MISDFPIDQNGKANIRKADKSLDLVTRILFTIAVIGQWIFVGYIVAFFGGIVLNGTYEKVNESLGHGIIDGDPMGNFMLAVHIFLAAIITFGGPLQFFTSLRNSFPVFHRWNGRIYLLTAFLISIAGLYMVYTRGAHGGITMLMGNTLNAVLIMAFSVLTWTTAMKKDFVAHKKWAIRAFLMVSGVWFFRIGYGLWIVITGFTAPGINENLNGPFDIFLTFAYSIFPLLILEFHFFAKAHSSAKVKRMASAVFTLLCLLLTTGIAGAIMIFWLPQF